MSSPRSTNNAQQRERHESATKRHFEAPRIQRMGTVTSTTTGLSGMSGMSGASGTGLRGWGFEQDPIAGS